MQVKNLAKRFGTTEALRGVDLSLARGSIIGLLGPNGSGKSTLMRIVSGLVKPDAGKVLWNGQTLPFPYFAIRRRCGVMIETPAIFPYLNAVENIQLSAHYLGIDLTNSQTTEILNRVGLLETRRDPVSKYSQGMKQRLGVAIALVNKPELLILDEPFNGLDPVGTKTLRRLIVELANEEGVAILLSSHQLHEIEFLCDRIVMMKKGLVFKEGSLLELNQGQPSMHLLECSSIDEAMTALSHFRVERNNDGQLSVWLTHEEVPLAIERLVAASISIYRITPEHRLESLFENSEK